MAISIQTQPFILSWQAKDAMLSMENNGAYILNLSTERTEVEMESTSPQLRIDQSDCFAEAGHMGIRDFMADSNAYAKQKFQEGVQRIVSDGDAYAAIENKVDPIPNMAYTNAYELFLHEFNYDAIPKSRPSIEVIRGDVNYSVKPAALKNLTEAQPLNKSYTPWDVQYAVEQYNSVNIQFDGTIRYENKI